MFPGRTPGYFHILFFASIVQKQPYFLILITKGIFKRFPSKQVEHKQIFCNFLNPKDGKKRKKDIKTAEKNKNTSHKIRS